MRLRTAMLAGLGDGLISGTSAGIVATVRDLTTLVASVIGATCGGGTGLASSFMARAATSCASGKLAGAAAGMGL
jgi:hypothetical protein